MSMIRYRPALEKDLTALAVLITELGYETTPTMMEARIAEIRANQGEVLVAELEQEVIGCINMIIDIRLAEGKAGEIVSLIVTQKCQGLGVGKGLVCAAEQWLIHRCDRVRVRANTLRCDAHRFYQSLGFTAVKTQQVFIKDLKNQ